MHGPPYMQRIYPNGHFNGAYFVVFTPTKMALHCPFHLQSSRKTRRTLPMRLEEMYEALATTTKPVFETNCASAWPWALGRPAVSATGWGKANSVLKRSKQVQMGGIRQKHDPMGLWANNHRQKCSSYVHGPLICATDLS